MKKDKAWWLGEILEGNITGDIKYIFSEEQRRPSNVKNKVDNARGECWENAREAGKQRTASL
jgi:hypothetical protein